ncbi:MAG: hypothetical protein E6K22_12400 [Gammaproteobacteria bacterium]|nr:MAG: hypothetical protein E6K22_12400 [Gammaproteobacteria bacterium]
MRQINSILIVLSREGEPSQVIKRGLMLARLFHAPIDLFLCEAECAYALEHQYPWEGAPPVAAALDVSGADSPELARTILLAANDISQICGGSLEVVYASRFEAAPPDAPQAARLLLASRAAAADVHARDVHRHSMTALLGTLTGRLIETVGCDLLLVRASPEAAAAELSAA